MGALLHQVQFDITSLVKPNLCSGATPETDPDWTRVNAALATSAWCARWSSEGLSCVAARGASPRTELGGVGAAPL